jgi:hypothetical protein
MKPANLMVLALVAVCLPAAPLALGQGSERDGDCDRDARMHAIE